MKHFFMILISIALFTGFLSAQDCEYWLHKVDPTIEKADEPADEHRERDVMTGIRCLLSQQGNQKEGVVFRDESHISQTLPIPTVEVGSLYYISLLFHGDHTFARAVALIGQPPKLKGEFGTLVFNSPEDVKKAYISYRKWFKIVCEVGLEEARRRKLDPLANSGVKWF